MLTAQTIASTLSVCALAFLFVGTVLKISGKA